MKLPPMFTLSGQIVDIVNKRIFPGSILVKNGKIEAITETEVEEKAETKNRELAAVCVTVAESGPAETAFAVDTELTAGFPFAGAVPFAGGSRRLVVANRCCGASMSVTAVSSS